MVKIKFGTSGRRAIISDQFTFDHAELVTAAIAQYVRRDQKPRQLIVGYDTRFQANQFAWPCAEWLSARGIQLLYCQSATPTPAIAYEIRRRADGAINFIASQLHETPVGFKYIGELIDADKIVIGGEESAGLTIKGHVQEKDGILTCLLVAEIVARRSKNLTSRLRNCRRESVSFSPPGSIGRCLLN